MSEALTETEKLADMVFQSVKVYVERKFATAIEAATAPLLEQIGALQKALADAPKTVSAEAIGWRIDSALQELDAVKQLALLTRDNLETLKGIQAEPGPQGEQGEPGKDAVVDEEAIAKAVEKAVAAIEVVVPDPEPGPPGEKGEAGKDAVIDEEAIAAAVEKAVAAIEIVVPIPEPGPPGKDGENGKDGAKGADAVVDYEAIDRTLEEKVMIQCGMLSKSIFKTVDDLVPAVVAKAVADIPAPTDGRDGRDGGTGPAGRDAADLVVLPAIDPECVYEMGTWARHRGGTWKAHRDTDELRTGSPMDAGWAPIVDGVADISWADSSDDGRTITLAVTLSTGRKAIHTIQTAVMIYRGVYEPGKEYARGDVVSFAGSMLLAHRSTSAMPETPGAGDDWRLAVKRGRDGKDAEGKPVGKREPLRLGGA